MTKVATAVSKELGNLPEELRGSPLAAAALLLAGRLDSGGVTDRDAAALSRELRLVLAELRALAGVGNRELEEFLERVSVSPLRDAAV